MACICYKKTEIAQLAQLSWSHSTGAAFWTPTKPTEIPPWKRVTNPALSLCCPNWSRAEVWDSYTKFWISKPLLGNKSQPCPQTAAHFWTAVLKLKVHPLSNYRCLLWQTHPEDMRHSNSNILREESWIKRQQRLGCVTTRGSPDSHSQANISASWREEK